MNIRPVTSVSTATGELTILQYPSSPRTSSSTIVRVDGVVDGRIRDEIGKRCRGGGGKTREPVPRGDASGEVRRKGRGFVGFREIVMLAARAFSGYERNNNGSGNINTIRRKSAISDEITTLHVSHDRSDDNRCYIVRILFVSRQENVRVCHAVCPCDEFSRFGLASVSVCRVESQPAAHESYTFFFFFRGSRTVTLSRKYTRTETSGPTTENTFLTSVPMLRSYFWAKRPVGFDVFTLIFIIFPYCIFLFRIHYCNVQKL